MGTSETMQDVAEVVSQAEMAEVEAQEMQLGEELQLSLCLPGEKNTDRLRRNRESAKRCRLRRKEYIMGVESKCTTLEQQNESLVLENRRLQQLVQQLMDKKSYEDTDASPCAKRVKLENGVTAADFNTESAAGDCNRSAGQSDHHSVFDSVNTLGIEPLDDCLDTSDNCHSDSAEETKISSDESMLHLEDQTFWLDNIVVEELLL